MDSEVYSFALKNTLSEIRNVCPEVLSTFIFKEDGEIVAQDESTPEKTIARVVDSFDGVLEKASAIGGVESITLLGSNGRANVSCVGDLYLVTVMSKKADEKYVSTLTHVLVPTVLKLVEKIHLASTEIDSPKPEVESEFSDEEESEENMDIPAPEPVTEEPENVKEPEIEAEAVRPEAPVNQLLVENLGGLLVPSDTVRIDTVVIAQWKEVYDDDTIEEVDIEAFNGKTTRCKFKPVKDYKYEGKGIIRMPEKIQVTLDVRKGELVKVKPVID